MGGRKPEAGKRRDVSVLLRVLPEERDAWKEAAAAADKGLSAWLRDLANRAVKRGERRSK